MKEKEIKKLLLTSDGFANPKIGQEFLALLNKKPVEAKVLFVPTASETEEEMSYVYKSEEELIALGILKENIVWLDMKNSAIVGSIKDYDVMYVCGGNTFHLMNEIRNNGFDKKITEFIAASKVYVGVSAGSVIMGPTILHIRNFDKNRVGLKDLTGFNMTDKIILPHYKSDEEEMIAKFEKENNYQVSRLPDGQAVEVLDGVSKFTG